MKSLAEHALSQLDSVPINKRKAKASPVRIFMAEHKKLISEMIRNGATTTVISYTFDLAPSCVRKHLSSVCGEQIKAICKVNGELASAASVIGSKGG